MLFHNVEFLHLLKYLYEVKNSFTPFSRLRLDEQEMDTFVHIPRKYTEIVLVSQIFIVVFIKIAMVQLPHLRKFLPCNLAIRTFFFHFVPEMLPFGRTSEFTLLRLVIMPFLSHVSCLNYAFCCVLNLSPKLIQLVACYSIIPI